MKKMKWILLVLAILGILGFWTTVIFSTIKGLSDPELKAESILDVTGEDPSESKVYESFVSDYEENFNSLKKENLKDTYVKVAAEGSIKDVVQNADSGDFKLTLITPENETIFLNVSSEYKSEILEYVIGQDLFFKGYLKIEQPLVQLGDRSFVGKPEPNNLYVVKDKGDSMSLQELSMARRALVLLENRKGVFSGVIINHYGYVITAYENISRYEDRTTGKLYIYDGQNETMTESYPLSLVTYDKDLNLALMKLPPSQGYPFVAMGESFGVGDRVASIRNRERLRDVVFDVDDGRIGDKVTINGAKYFYTEEEIYGSGSGSMIVDFSGHFIGMNMFRWVDEYREKEMNFAIDTIEIREFIDKYAIKNQLSVKEYTKDLFSKTYDVAEQKAEQLKKKTGSEDDSTKPKKPPINSTLNNPYEVEKAEEDYQSVYGELYSNEEKEE